MVEQQRGNAMSNAMTFAPAKRKASFARIACVGASGSGKTFSSIRLARGLVGKEGRIAVVDTENGSASLYEGLAKTKGQPTGFDVMELGPPWNVPRFEAAIKAAVDAKYDAVILDQVSWLWEGDGGLLEAVDTISKSSKSGDSFGAWKKVTPMYWDFIRAILLAPIHVIVCMRAKVAWEIQKSDNGKNKPVKIGMKPIQREGFDYEMTVVWNISAEHGAEVDKDRTNLFHDRLPAPLSEADGERLAKWLSSGEAPTIDDHAKALLPQGTPVDRERPKQSVATRAALPIYKVIDVAQRKAIVAAGQKAELGAKDVLDEASVACGFEITTTANIPVEKFDAVMKRLTKTGGLAPIGGPNPFGNDADDSAHAGHEVGQQ